jgi:transcription initiation factor TFIIIB Brf1 subunit/transcription initiation factor TFIIB
MMSHRCTYCDSDNVFVDFSSGDTTCHDCGTVLDERLISDDFEHNRWCMDSHTAFASHDPSMDIGVAPRSNTPPSFNNRHYTRAPSNISKQILNDFLGALNLINTSLAVHAHDLRERVMKKYQFKAKPLAAAMACCAYLACRDSGYEKIPRSATEVYVRLGVDGSMFKRILKQVLILIPNETAQKDQRQHVKYSDGLIRQIQMLKSIPIDQEHAIAFNVMKLNDIRKAHTYMMATKPVALNAVLIVLACEQLKINIDESEVISNGWISKPTLKKHADKIRSWVR